MTPDQRKAKKLRTDRLRKQGLKSEKCKELLEKSMIGSFIDRLSHEELVEYIYKLKQEVENE